mmetsp:Transcript_2958/g.6013  ORF Transcript_2958/g.6013 Transcript_2958/m.6013 type:complete len:206 (+) Transcript_2958:497-1114(+)
MIVCPSFSHNGKIISFNTLVFASASGHTTLYCLITSNDKSSFSINTWFAPGTIFCANRFTFSLNVAENNNICKSGAAALSCLINLTESSANPSCLSISSASSNTRIFIVRVFNIRLLIQSFNLPCVPTTTCSSTFLRLFPGVLVSAVDARLIPVYVPIFSNTPRFCTTNSRVGHKHNACGALTDVSTLESIASVKHVVFPLPLCA